jgi:serine/threonine-protein kinase RsbW
MTENGGERSDGRAHGGSVPGARGGERAQAVLESSPETKMTENAVVHLALSNDAENVSLVRHVIGGIADTVAMSERLTADVKTAVSEACANVVLHAYGGAPGPLLVSIGATSTGLTVLVRDRGGGIKPRRVDEEQRVLGVGLSLIQALTDSVEFRGTRKQGTEVRMNFRPAEGSTLRAPRSLPEELLEDEPQGPDGEAIVAVSGGTLAAAALGAVIAVLASRASFSVDRLSDAQLVTDTIAAHADGLIDGRYLVLAVRSAERQLDLRLGPLGDGGADRLVEATTVGKIRPLEVLADEVAAEAADGREYLRLHLSA